MSPWTTLGLKRTDDVAEIRRAYARKLKAIDVDADPAAFVTLRAALEQAMRDAEHSRHYRARATAALPDEIPSGESAAPVIAMEAPPGMIVVPAPAAPVEAAPPPAPPPRASDAETTPPAPEEEAPRAAEDNARYVALENLLFQDADASPPDPEALTQAVRAILDHPDMDQVDRGTNVELWLAEILLQSVPRSDPVIPLAIAHFHWDRRAGHWDQPHMFAQLVGRRTMFAMMDRLDVAGHPLHAAWKDLRSDKRTLGPRPPGRKGDVADLLSQIRSKAPGVEAYLDPHRVELWDEVLGNKDRAFGGSGGYSGSGGSRGGFNWIWLGFIALAALSRVFSAVNSPSTPSTTTPPYISTGGYSSPDFDLDIYLDRATSHRLNLADLAERNPALRDRLIARWNEAHDGEQPRDLFDVEVRGLIDDAIGEGLRGGSYELQIAYWRIRVEELRQLEGTDVEACAGMTAEPPSLGPIDQTMGDVNAQALSDPPSHPPPALAPGTTSHFAIPAAIVERARQLSHLDGAALSAAFQGRGTSTERCAGRIALIQAAIDAPEREGAMLIRELSRAL